MLRNETGPSTSSGRTVVDLRQFSNYTYTAGHPSVGWGLSRDQGAEPSCLIACSIALGPNLRWDDGEVVMIGADLA